MRRIRIAQIGVSPHSHGHEIFKSLIKQPELFEMVGYALPEGERERFPHRAKVLDGYCEMTVEEILNDPTIEAVTVETEEVHLTRYARLAAEHGKHIHMEKPGGQELAAFEELIRTVQKQGTVFHTGYMYRYNPYVQELLEQIGRGELGEIISVDAEMSCFHQPVIRQWLATLEGGMMFFLGCHLIDLILRIKGTPRRVLPLNKQTGLDDVHSEDFGMAVLEYENGVCVAKANATQKGGYSRRALVVTGSEKTVVLGPLEMRREGGLYTGRTVYSERDWFDEGEYTETPVFDRYDGMMASFAAMVRGEKENPYSPDYELELYKTILKCCGVEEK